MSRPHCCATAAEDAPSLVVASLGGSLRETVGAPLERALDEAAAACLDEYDADARLDHFRRLKRCVGEARDALARGARRGPADADAPRLRLALDWEGRFFSVEKPRRALSLGARNHYRSIYTTPSARMPQPSATCPRAALAWSINRRSPPGPDLRRFMHDARMPADGATPLAEPAKARGP